MYTVQTHSWKSLNSLQFLLEFHESLPLLQISNCNQQLLLFPDFDYCCQQSERFNKNILQYNINDNSWCEWTKYPEKIRRSICHTPSINKNKATLFICNNAGHIIKLI